MKSEQVLEVPATVVHFYRATVMHADVWRQRLDATTNWAVVTAATMVTFAFSDPKNPHFLLLLAAVIAGLFLTMESRRYQIYDLWRQRVRILNRYVIAPALDPRGAPSREVLREELAALATELGSSVPHLSFLDAVGYRLRRNYLLVFGAILTTWTLKLWYHPAPASTLAEYITRPSIGLIPGPTVLTGIMFFVFVIGYLASRARTEQMEEWTELPSPLRRALIRQVPERETSLLSEEGLRKYETPRGGVGDLLKKLRPGESAPKGPVATESEPPAEPLEVTMPEDESPAEVLED